MTYQEWMIKNDCDHGHCPNDCDHPQPFWNDQVNALICGRCAFKFNEVMEMIPCTPINCDEAR